MTNTVDYNEFLDNLKDIANEHINEILDTMDCENSSVHAEDIRSCCPIHNGDNTTAFSYNTNIKSWRCYTHNCHNNYVSNIFGLVQGYLERIKEPHTFNHAVKWIIDTLSLDMDSIITESVVDEQYLEIKRLIKESYNKINLLQSKTKTLNIKVSDVQKNHIPSEYYKGLGLSDELIDKYLLNDCVDKTKPMFNRACVPVVDETGENVIGVTGRIMMGKCQYCEQFHEDYIACHERKIPLPKWKHYGFSSGNVLFNFNNAKKFIKQSKSVILTEGPKDVFAFEKNNIKNSVGIFGLNISLYHIKCLLDCGVMNVILALDNDDAAVEYKEESLKILKKYFKIYDISYILDFGYDFFDMDQDVFDSKIKPTIKNMEFQVNV